MKSKKKLLAAVLAAALACTGLSMQEIRMRDVFAAEDVENDFVINNGVLEEYKGAGGDVVIPEGIAQIGDCAFELLKKRSSPLQSSV